MLFFKNLVNYFTINALEPELNRERFSALMKQVPLMYSILTVNLISLAYPHIGSAPDYLTIYIPAAFCLVFLYRNIVYYRTSLDNLKDDKIVKRLNSTVILSIIISIIFVIWAMVLAQYASDLMLVHIVFFLYITLYCCIFCLLHIMQSAIYLTLIIILPSFLYLITHEELVFKAIGVNSLLVSAGLIFLVTNHYKNFTSLVAQKIKLTEQSSQLEKLNQNNLQLANMDSLTSLPNRRSFFSQLGELTSRQDSLKHQTTIVGLLDLDGFKRVNDVFGHPTGDDLLVKTSERLHNILGEDIVLARLGGDEFGLIINKAEDVKNVIGVGEKICEAMRLPFKLREGSVQITATIGFVEYPTMGEDSKTLFERADYALCYSKQNSKGKPVIFSSDHETIIREVSSIEHQLHEADLNKELSIMFQPIVDMHSGKTKGFEALARWNNPILGYVRPDIFIRSAEQMGTVSKLTSILLSKALKLACEWPDELYMSFNLSIHDLSSPQTVLNIINIVEKSNFPNDRIVFEVTETAVMHDFEKANEALHMLKLLGAEIALDDFGTGYSSLSYVQRMPIDRLKIDRSFINEIDTDKNTRNIVRTIIDLCNNLDLYCIVEGVETEDQLAALEQVGGRYIQGYYYSRPLVPEDALDYLAQHIDMPKVKTLAEKWSNV